MEVSVVDLDEILYDNASDLGEISISLKAASGFKILGIHDDITSIKIPLGAGPEKDLAEKKIAMTIFSSIGTTAVLHGRTWFVANVSFEAPIITKSKWGAFDLDDPDADRDWES